MLGRFTAGWRRALVLGAVYAMLATPLDSLGSSESLAAVVWPAPAVAIAWLWRVRRDEWPAALLAILLVMVVVGHLDELPFWVDVSFALVNAVGVGSSLLLGHRFVGADGHFDTAARFTRFVLLLPGVVVFVTAAIGAELAHIERGLSWLAEWRTIIGSNGLPVLVLVPGILEWTRARDPDGRAAPWWAVLVPAVCGGFVMVEAFRIRLSNELEHGLLALLLIWAAVAGSIRAATLAAFTLATTGVVLTVTGNGSYHQAGVAGVRQLQIDLAVLSMLVLFVAIAIAERRNYEILLERGRKLESLGMLASGVAHDFNNVLAAVGGHAEHAQELLPDASPAQRPLHHVQAAVRSGRAMTEQMLLAVGRGAPRREERLSLDTVLEEAVALAGSDRHDGKRIDLRLDGAAHHERVAAWHACGDQGQVVRALLNLLRNAVQAARAQVRVEARLHDARAGRTAVKPVIGVVPRAPYFRITVSDDGTGIAPALAARIFEPFFSTKLGKSGHGLGLSITAGIIVDHHGGIVCDTGPLGGAAFHVLLPAHRGAAGASESQASAVTRRQAGGAADAHAAARPGGADHQANVVAGEVAGGAVDRTRGAGIDAVRRGRQRDIAHDREHDHEHNHERAPARRAADAPWHPSEDRGANGEAETETVETVALAAGLAPPGAGETILVVEDDDSLRALLEDWLAEQGFEPLSYASGDDACASLRAAPEGIAALVTDLETIGLPGDALAAVAREVSPGLPVLLISGAARGAAVAAALDLPFLAKPFDAGQFADALAGLRRPGVDATTPSATLSDALPATESVSFPPQSPH